MGAHAEWVIESSGGLSLAANSDVIPVVIVTRTPTYVTREVVLPGGGTLETNEQTGSKPVYGAGVSPFGFKLRIGSAPKIRFFGGQAPETLTGMVGINAYWPRSTESWIRSTPMR